VKNQITQKKEPILSTTNPTEIGLGLNPTLFTQMLLKYRVIRNDCRGFNNLSYTIHL